jgi:hypothetical protein
MTLASHPHSNPQLPSLDRLADVASTAELARFKASPRTPESKVRIAPHVMGRKPDSVWPLLTLAEYASAPFVREVYLAQAVQRGYRAWGPWLKEGAQPVAWWKEEATRPFMVALSLYGTDLVRKGNTMNAAVCLAQLLRMDPTDRIGAVSLFTEAARAKPYTGAERSSLKR